MSNLLYYPFNIILTTGILYGLWWLHHDHPLGAAFLAAIGITIYEKFLEHLPHRYNSLETRITDIRYRVEELEDLNDERDSTCI